MLGHLSQKFLLFFLFFFWSIKYEYFDFRCARVCSTLKVEIFVFKETKTIKMSRVRPSKAINNDITLMLLTIGILLVSRHVGAFTLLSPYIPPNIFHLEFLVIPCRIARIPRKLANSGLLYTMSVWLAEPKNTHSGRFTGAKWRTMKNPYLGVSRAKVIVNELDRQWRVQSNCSFNCHLKVWNWKSRREVIQPLSPWNSCWRPW